ncbi:MAG: AraC family transcriptional regulator [Hominisplanchenecus sp.]
MEDAYVLQLLEPKFKEFHLCFCGYADCEPLHSYGPASRPNYIIHYILDGKGIYQVGERKYSLSKGQGFLIEPETLTFYQADREEPWSYLWIGFGGIGAEKLIQDIGLNSRQLTFQCDYGDELKEIVFSMLKHTGSTASNLYYLQGRLYDFFSVLTRDSVVDSYEDTTKESMYVQEAIAYIRNNYSKGITVSDISEYLNINRSYLYTIFKNDLDLSPKEFLTKFCISRAKEQLTLTDLPVEYIANSCGYKSTIVFTKAFKQEIGITPSQYRKTNRKETKSRLAASREELDEIGGKRKKFI